MKKLAYIAMPYRGKHQWEVHQNIQAAYRLAMKYWRLGFVAICPHGNTAYFSCELPDSVWLKGDLEILRRCDCIVMGPRWEKSRGARQELRKAKKWGLEIIFDDSRETELYCYGYLITEASRERLEVKQWHEAE